MTIKLGCIADDFTGATDLANNLVRAGMRTVQALSLIHIYRKRGSLVKVGSPMRSTRCAEDCATCDSATPTDCRGTTQAVGSNQALGTTAPRCGPWVT